MRPELVVEIALDGVQASTRYPGGVARFARVKGYRPDKSPRETDTIDALRALLPARPAMNSRLPRRPRKCLIENDEHPQEER